MATRQASAGGGAVGIPRDIMGRQGMGCLELGYTDVALGISGSFVGNYYDIDILAKVVITVSADQAGTAYIDWAQDLAGTNAVYSDTLAVVAGTPAYLLTECKGPYARVRYVNGATAQAAFKLAFNGKVT